MRSLFGVTKAGDQAGLQSYIWLFQDNGLESVPPATMDHFTMLQSLGIDDALMVVLTGINPWSVVWQAMNTKRLAEISIRAEQRACEQNKPQVKIVHHTQHVGTGDTRKSFVGFSITNASPFEVTITSISLGLGIPSDKLFGPVTPSMHPSHVDQYCGTRLSDCSLPRRLQYGEPMRVIYDEEDLVAALKQKEGDQPTRVRPQCTDSLGNRHTMPCWITWDKDVVHVFSDPGTGLITAEQWVEQLPRPFHSRKKRTLGAVYTRLLRR